MGGSGDDTLGGWDGDDELRAGSGNDVLRGGNGADRLAGEDDDDMLSGGSGSDTLDAGAGDDWVDTGEGDDEADLGAGDDYVTEVRGRMSGEDRLFGGTGDDTLHGGAEVGGRWATDDDWGFDPGSWIGGDGDFIDGGDGDDWIVGGAGDDMLVGGTGADTFVFGRDAGRDFIAAYDLSAEDVLLVRNADGTGYMTDAELADAVYAERASPYDEPTVFLLHEGGRILFSAIRVEEVMSSFCPERASPTAPRRRRRLQPGERRGDRLGRGEVIAAAKAVWQDCPDAIRSRKGRPWLRVGLSETALERDFTRFKDGRRAKGNNCGCVQSTRRSSAGLRTDYCR